MVNAKKSVLLIVNKIEIKFYTGISTPGPKRCGLNSKTSSN